MIPDVRQIARATLCSLSLLGLATAVHAATPLLQPGKHTLYQRIITRPGASLFSDASGKDAKPLPGFEVFYVFGRAQGRVQIGSSAQGPVQGWIDDNHTIPWAHTMVATFTNPAGRNRALFLDTAQHEEDLLSAADSAARVDALTKGVQAGHSAPVVAMEPENFVDPSKNFYLLPVLDATQIERDSGPAIRMLHVISASTTTGNTARTASPETLKQFKAGLVFVIDTTASMQPYIDQTRAAISSIIHSVQNTAVSQNFRFGLVAYRDSLADTPGLEYATKLYASPDFSQSLDAILPAISTVHDASVSSSSFDEDAIAGVKTAVDQVPWQTFNGRYIVLITDAGARSNDDPHSLTHLNIEDMNHLAASKGIALFVIHLLTPAGNAANDHGKAATQYRNLSKFNNAGSLYYPVPGGSPDAFRPVIQTMSTSMLQQVADMTGRPVAGLTPQDAKVDTKLSVVSQAMRLAYLGDTQHTAAPDIINAFTSDRDPADTLHRTLNIRVLLTRNQLSDLANALQHILDAGLAGRTAPENFFTQLQSAFAASARDPNAFSHIDTIGPLLGEYLDGLPYKSDVTSITQESWLAMGAVGQRTILNNIASRLRLYQEYESDPSLWGQIGQSHDDGERVYPVPLEALP